MIIPHFIKTHYLLAFEIEKSISELTNVLNSNFNSSKSWTRTKRGILVAEGGSVLRVRVVLE